MCRAPFIGPGMSQIIIILLCQSALTNYFFKVNNNWRNVCTWIIIVYYACVWYRLVWLARPLSPSPDYCFEFKNRGGKLLNSISGALSPSTTKLSIMNRRRGVHGSSWPDWLGTGNLYKFCIVYIVATISDLINTPLENNYQSWVAHN